MAGAGAFAPSAFDPVLITARIVAMQSALYATFGVWLLLLGALAGADASELRLDLLFAHARLSLYAAGAPRLAAALFLNGLTGGCMLALVVERAKKCLDFAATAHFVHLCLCSAHGGFPSSWEWWVLNGASLGAMATLGEYLCMRRELRDIPLFTGTVSQELLLFPPSEKLHKSSTEAAA